MRRNDASSSAPSRNGVTSGSQIPDQYSSSFSSHVSRRSRATNKKTPSEPAGPLRSSRLLMLNRTARAKTQFPRRRIFSLSVRCGSACAQYRGRRRRCQRKRQRIQQPDSRPETSAALHCLTVSPKIHHDIRARHPRPLQIVRPAGGRRPRSCVCGRASSTRCSARTAPAKPRRCAWLRGCCRPMPARSAFAASTRCAIRSRPSASSPGSRTSR